METSRTEVTTPTLATIGARFLARLLDVVLQLVVGTAVLAVAAGGFGDIPDAPAWAPWAVWGLGLVYEVVAIAVAGRTVGKALLHVRVVDAGTDGRPRPWQAAARAFPMVVGRIPFLGILAVVPYVPALWDPRRRGWHDRVAGTIVVATD